MRAEVRGRAMELGEGHPFLFCERVLAMCHQALDAWEHGRAHFARSVAGGFVIAIRLSPAGDASLTLGEARPGADAITTFPCLAVPDLVESCLAFGRGVVRAVRRRDRAQCVNLRLTSFRRQLRETSDALREVCREDAKINPTPEPYRAFVSSQRSSATPSHVPMPLTAGRLRYVPRWRALVPGIDLRATFLCGDRLIVGASAETFCLERATGEVMWRIPTERATAVVTPGGIARLAPDGELCVHDFGNGEVTMRTQIATRLGAPPTGAVVNVPGLPKLLIVTEGDRHIVAIDLASGEARWRFAWNTQGRTTSGERARGGALRMKRAGRLLYIASGDSALTALDVQTGRVVWRVRNRLRFRSAPTVDHDRLFALTGGVNSPAELLAVDAFTGEVRWRSPVLEGAAPCTVEGVPLVASRAVACAIRDRHGLKLAAFGREDGEALWTSEAPVAPIGTSWLAVDDLFIGNSPTGELSAIRADGGSLLYRHLLGRVLEADVPRRLEPVLRSGALFVPHTDVHVFRPSDGTPLGTVGPCDAIPDLLRVDERCDVYVAEESGHLCSFGVGPRLSLVR
jgi:outer membrane protein assembly factor BamB